MGGKKNISDSVTLVGVMEHGLNLFDELMPLPKGTSYNAYLIKGSEKTALIDTVEPRHKETLLKNIKASGVDTIDYIISNHSEQDHSGSIPFILEKYPNAIVVCSEKAEKLLLHEHAIESSKLKIVKDHETLSLGDKTIEFIYAPWVHWPETMFTYLQEEKTLFTCDFLGAHLAFEDELWATKSTIEEPAKRYYAEIMMPFANVIRTHLTNLEKYELDIVCPSHGPLYKKPEIILDLYKDWVSERVDKKVVIAYVSMHGSTKNMVEHLEKDLKKDGLAVKTFHLTDAEPGAVVEELLNCSTLILASPAYLGGLHPTIANFAFTINGFKPNIKIQAFINSFGWGSIAEQQLQQLTPNIKGIHAGSIIVEGHPTNEQYEQLEVLSEKIKEMNKNLDNLDQYKADENKETEKTNVKMEATQTKDDENFFEQPSKGNDSDKPTTVSLTQEAKQTTSTKRNKIETSAGNKYRVQIQEIIEETPSVKSFVFRVPGEYTFMAGQDIMVSFPDEHSVNNKKSIPLSISNPPTDHKKVILTIRNMGGFTAELHTLKEGDELIVTAPVGKTFAVPEENEDDYVFIAGGTGITPFMSIMRLFLAKGKRNKITLLDANKSKEEIIFKKELDKIAQEQEQIKIVHTLDSCPVGWDGEEGFICEGMIKKHLSDDELKNRTWFVCGPPPMIKQMKEVIKAVGVPSKNIHIEDWQLPGQEKNVEAKEELKNKKEPTEQTSHEQKEESTHSDGQATLASESQEVQLSPGPILDAAEQLGVPFSCKQGICGTCEVEVIEGAENLEPKTEKEENMNLPDGHRLCCQAKIKGGKVKIDF